MQNELAALQQRFDRLNLLYRVGNVIHSTLEPQKALELILEQAVSLTQASSGSVVLINPTTGFLEIEASHGLPDNAVHLKLRTGEGITGWVARTGKTARVGDVHEDPRYIMVRENVRSEMAVPLFVSGELRGILNMDSDRQNAFSEFDQELLEELAVQAAKVIHNTWLYEQIRQKAGLFESLVNVSRTINSTMNLDDVLQAITREAGHLMHAKMSSLLLVDHTGEWLDLRASHGAGPDYIKKPRLNVSDSLVGAVVRRRKPMQVDDVRIANRYHNIEIAQKEGLVALLSVPLQYGANSIGALNVYLAYPHVFSNEEIRILTSLAELSAIAIEKARLYERLVDMEERLRQNEKLSALGLLAAEVAHEIRNPLTVIKMLFHSLDLSFPQNDPRSTDVRVIEDKMNHLNKIVEQILGFAHTAEPQLGPIDVARVIEELCLLIRHKLRQQNIELKRQVDEGLPQVNADASLLSQAFLNLVLNAVQAMPQGGTLTITLRRLPRDTNRICSHVAVEFRDNGQGMSADQQRNAFSSILSTTHPKGTGLGLALVSRAVETHHGKIMVKSEPGKGTLFRILLPAPSPN